MRAVVVREFGEIGLAKVEEVPWPVPAANEVLVEVAAVAANFVDTLVLEGKYQFLPERPFTPGKLPAGVVSAVGAAVTQFKPGDRVLTMAEQGGYAQAVCVNENQCYLLPDGLPFDATASLSLAFDTAWFALFERGRLAPGESVLVLGASGAVGHAAVQLAKAKGARVIAAVSSAEKGQRLLEAGADAFVNIAVEDLKEDLRRQIHAANGGQGVDVVIDPLGGDVFDAALRCMAWRGRLVVVGFAAGRIPTVKVNYLMLKNIEVSGLQVSDYRKRLPDMMRTCFMEVFDLYVRGAITPSESVAYDLADYAAALKDLTGRKLSARPILHPFAARA